MPYLAERGQNTAGLEKRPGAFAVDLLTKRHVLGLPWVRPEEGGARRDTGQSGGIGRITHQAETVPGQGGMKSPAGLTLAEGKGLGELMPGPPHWGLGQPCCGGSR